MNSLSARLTPRERYRNSARSFAENHGDGHYLGAPLHVDVDMGAGTAHLQEAADIFRRGERLVVDLQDDVVYSQPRFLRGAAGSDGLYLERLLVRRDAHADVGFAGLEGVQGRQ